MSSYVNIYLRDGNVFLPIGDYSRSSQIYGALEHMLPYEKLTAIDIDMLDNGKSILVKEIENLTNYIELKEKMKSLVMTANNTLDEKMEAVWEIDNDIVECRDEIEYKNHAINTLNVLHGYVEYPLHNDRPYVYAGIECCPDLNDEVEIVGEGVIEVFHPTGKRN